MPLIPAGEGSRLGKERAGDIGDAPLSTGTLCQGSWGSWKKSRAWSDWDSSGFRFLPGWVVGNRHVGVAGAAFAKRQGSSGDEKRGEFVRCCFNLVGSAFGTAPRRGASAQVARLALAPSSPAQSAVRQGAVAPLQHGTSTEMHAARALGPSGWDAQAATVEAAAVVAAAPCAPFSTGL
ncbi:hypothetical protein P7K49_036642 [Saguinus oedipus]|uniref:Uncharacterized protein n=1 Tax=Saguinus oedipus TaxID=9490 RepID=A0ABQ9TMC6_SAGOE|nr:hypothetical protein P7K49_036642 [Saguinus oedipus]